MQQERRKKSPGRRRSDHVAAFAAGDAVTWKSVLFQVIFCAIVFGLWFLLTGCAAHVPAFAPSSVQLCAEYSRDRALDEDYRRSRRLGASACVTFDDQKAER
jgi:hypothetical protein